MTSPTGNNRAFTFVEVMVALVILSAGIVLIYKTFFLGVDYLSRLSLRLHANELLDAKIADMSRLFEANGNINFDRGPLTVTQNINHHNVDFLYQIQMQGVPGFQGLYRMQVSVFWPESGHEAHMSRWALLG